MGKRGPLANPKPGNRPVLAAAGPVPAPASDWSGQTIEQWNGYWTGPAARLAERVDLAAITRLFGLYDQHAKSVAILAQGLVVRGSVGQIRVNPLADHALRLESAILRLENELG